TGSDQTTAVDRDGAINLIKETEKFGQKKFVMLSSISADEVGEASEAMKHYLKMKQEADEYLRGTELVYTIVRPGYLTNELGTSKIKVERKVVFAPIPEEEVVKQIFSTLEKENRYLKPLELFPAIRKSKKRFKN